MSHTHNNKIFYYYHNYLIHKFIIYFYNCYYIYEKNIKKANYN